MHNGYLKANVHKANCSNLVRAIASELQENRSPFVRSVSGETIEIEIGIKDLNQIS